jgi:hypothetical protein
MAYKTTVGSLADRSELAPEGSAPGLAQMSTRIDESAVVGAHTLAPNIPVVALPRRGLRVVRLAQQLSHRHLPPDC